MEPGIGESQIQYSADAHRLLSGLTNPFTHNLCVCTFVEKLIIHEQMSLKVVGNEKQGRSGRRQMLGDGLGRWR